MDVRNFLKNFWRETRQLRVGQAEICGVSLTAIRPKEGGRPVDEVKFVADLRDPANNAAPNRKVKGLTAHTDFGLAIQMQHGGVDESIALKRLVSVDMGHHLFTFIV